MGISTTVFFRRSEGEPAQINAGNSWAFRATTMVEAHQDRAHGGTDEPIEALAASGVARVL